MFRVKHRFIMCAIICLLAFASASFGLEYGSYIYTTADIVFFSYEDNTQVEIYDVNNQLVWPIAGPVILSKGEHILVRDPYVFPKAVYFVTGSKKFAVLIGDAVTQHTVGYYAMDARGMGTAKEFYTYVPTLKYSSYLGYQRFIVFAYSENTTVTVCDDANNTINKTFVLGENGYYEDANLSNNFIHVTADKPVSVLTCHDAGYFVPDSSGKWTGKNFHTYVPYLWDGSMYWPASLNVIAHENDTNVVIKRLNPPNTVIWSGILNNGQVHTDSNASVWSQYVAVSASKPVAVCVKGETWEFSEILFAPEKGGTGVAQLNRDVLLRIYHTSNEYVKVLSHFDDTSAKIYDANGYLVKSFTLNAGQIGDNYPPRGLYRVTTNKGVSVYSGSYGTDSWEDSAEYAPLSFNTKLPLLGLTKDNNDPNNDCVEPYDPNKQNYLTFDIHWSANGYADTNVVVVEQLPAELDYNSSEPNGDYDWQNRTVTWTIGNIGAGDSGHIVLKTQVNEWAGPCGVISNTVTIEGEKYLTNASCDVNVCSWGSQIIYVDQDANGFNGTSWDDAYKDLQDAIVHARNCPGSIAAIWVAAGTYKPVNDTNGGYQSKSFELPDSVALIGHFGGIGTYETNPDQRDLSNPANETVLNGQIGQNPSQAVNCVLKGQNINSALVDGFTIKNAYGAGISLDDAKVSIVNCKVTNNQNTGIDMNNGSDADVYNCTFTNNGDSQIDVNNCWPEISSCVFDGNDTTNEGVRISNISAVTIKNCILQNHSLYAINADWSSVTVSYSDISHCGASGIYETRGSGLTLGGSRICWNNGDGISLSQNLDTEITNNWIHNNGAAGISFTYQVSAPLVRNNTIYDNHTYGIWSSQSGNDPNVINCIISGNDTNDLYRQNGSFNTVNYCLLQHDHNGIGNITGSPGFVNPTDPNDLHLDVTSQCKNAGDPNGNYSNEHDIDGEPRVSDGRVDIGGDECYWSKADYNRDANVNFYDFNTLAGAWGMQDEPNISIDDDTDVDINDLKLFCDDWLWQPLWGDNQWMQMAGDGGASLSLGMESISTLESDIIQTDSGDALMLPDAKSSLAARPARLRARTDKFYKITPDTTIPAQRSSLKVINPNAVELLKLLDESWSTGQLEGVMTEQEYLELRRYTEEAAGVKTP